MTQRKKGLFFMPHILGHSLKASRFLNALLAAALDSSPCVSLNINMSAPVCFISLNTESVLFHLCQRFHSHFGNIFLCMMYHRLLCRYRHVHMVCSPPVWGLSLILALLVLFLLLFLHFHCYYFYYSVRWLLHGTAITLSCSWCFPVLQSKI